MINFSKFCSESLHHDTDRRCCLQNSWKLSDGKSVKACVIYWQKKTFFRLPRKLWLLRGSRPKFAMASPQHLADNFPNFIQIGSLSAELKPAAWRPFKMHHRDGLDCFQYRLFEPIIIRNFWMRQFMQYSIVKQVCQYSLLLGWSICWLHHMYTASHAINCFCGWEYVYI